MSNKTSSIYYCNQCKNVSSHVKEVLFVEQNRFRSFCSEECISNFFAPLVDFYRQEENRLRKEKNFTEEFPFTNRDFEKIIEYSLRNPQEIWVTSDDLSEEICYLITKLNPLPLIDRHQHKSVSEIENNKQNLSDPPSDIYCIIIGLLFENTPSFILSEIITRYEPLVDFYRKGKPLSEYLENKMKIVQKEQKLETIPTALDGQKMMETEDSFGFQDERIPEDILMVLENKRNILLSEMTRDRSEVDIPIETFQQYELFLSETIERPDEMYRYNDHEKDEIFIYIRTYSHENNSFYYIVLGLPYHPELDRDDSSLVIPIMSFPTQDVDLYRKYKKGEKIGGPAIN